jgi:hypothetical protein
LQAHELFLKQSGSIVSNAAALLQFEVRFANDTFTKHEKSGRLSELCSRQTIELFPSTFEQLFRDYFLQSGVQKFNGILNKLVVVLEQRLYASRWADRSFINALHKKVFN